jgi:hypothetical protein
MLKRADGWNYCSMLKFVTSRAPNKVGARSHDLSVPSTTLLDISSSATLSKGI